MLVSSVSCYTIQKNRFRQSFKSKVTKDYPDDSASSKIKNLIDRFEENPDCFHRLGSGQCAEVYVLDSQDKLVVKKSLPMMETTNNKFKDEAYMLQKIPSTFKTAQQFNTRVKTERGNYFLVSTLMQGKPINYINNKISSEAMFKVLDGLFKLDINGLYHNDLSLNNILIDSYNANLIDFQWATIFSPYMHNERTNVYFPPSIIPANSINFEQTGFASYLFKVNKNEGKAKAREILRKYLKQKSIYHQKRYRYFKNKAIQDDVYRLSDGSHNKVVFKPLKYELALSRVYSHPNDDILDIELMRMEFLYSQKRSYRFTDPNMRLNVNSLNAYSYIGNTVMALANFRHKLEQYQEKYADEKYMRRYIRYNKELATYYSNLFRSWFDGTFYYLKDLTVGNAKINGIKDLDKNINNINDFENLKTFTPMMSDNSQIYDVPMKSITPDNNLNLRGFAKRLKAATQELRAQTQLKIWYARFFEPDKTNIYNQIRNISKQINDSITYLENDNPVNAVIVALYARFILQKLYNVINDNDKEEDLLKAKQACYETIHILSGYLVSINSDITFSLTQNNIYRLSRVDDAQISKIYDYNY